MVYTLRFFSSKYSFSHNSIVFGACIIHILYTECAKIKKNNSGSKRLTLDSPVVTIHTISFNVKKFYVRPTQCI